MPTYVCSSHLFSGLCSKLPSKYLPEEKKNRSTCSSRCIRGILQVLYFCQKFNSTQAPIKDAPRSPFWTRTACLPGGKLELKKNAFSRIIKTNSVLRGKFLGGNTAGGRSGGGRRKRREETRRARSRGHVHLPFSVAIRDIPLNHST